MGKRFILFFTIFCCLSSTLKADLNILNETINAETAKAQMPMICNLVRQITKIHNTKAKRALNSVLETFEEIALKANYDKPEEMSASLLCYKTLQDASSLSATDNDRFSRHNFIHSLARRFEDLVPCCKGNAILREKQLETKLCVAAQAIKTFNLHIWLRHCWFVTKQHKRFLLAFIPLTAIASWIVYDLCKKADATTGEEQSIIKSIGKSIQALPTTIKNLGAAAEAARKNVESLAKNADELVDIAKTGGPEGSKLRTTLDNAAHMTTQVKIALGDACTIEPGILGNAQRTANKLGSAKWEKIPLFGSVFKNRQSRNATPPAEGTPVADEVEVTAEEANQDRRSSSSSIQTSERSQKKGFIKRVVRHLRNRRPS